MSFQQLHNDLLIFLKIYFPRIKHQCDKNKFCYTFWCETLRRVPLSKVKLRASRESYGRRVWIPRLWISKDTFSKKILCLVFSHFSDGKLVKVNRYCYLAIKNSFVMFVNVCVDKIFFKWNQLCIWSIYVLLLIFFCLRAQ